MNKNNDKIIAEPDHVYNEKTYIRNVVVILAISLLFLMMRFGAIIPDLEKLEIKGFRILNLSKTIAALYLVWIYLYLSFYQKYWREVKKDIARSKQSIFKDNIAFSILRETHERLNHDFDWFAIHSLSFDPIMKFWISYSPVSFLEHGEEKDHGSRHWVIDLKRKKNRKYMLPYLVNVYCRSPLVTLYFIPIFFPIIAGIICILGNWPGNLMTIIANW